MRAPARTSGYRVLNLAVMFHSRADVILRLGTVPAVFMTSVWLFPALLLPSFLKQGSLAKGTVPGFELHHSFGSCRRDPTVPRRFWGY